MTRPARSARGHHCRWALLAMPLLALALAHAGPGEDAAARELCPLYAKDAARYAVWATALQATAPQPRLFRPFRAAMASFHDGDPGAGVRRLAQMEGLPAQTDGEWEALQDVGELRWYILTCDRDWRLGVPPAPPVGADPRFLHLFPERVVDAAARR